MLDEAYIREARERARRFQGAWTGTSGTLAADVMRLLQERDEMIEGPVQTAGPTKDQIAARWAAVRERHQQIHARIREPIARTVFAAEEAKPAAGTTAKFGTGAVRSSDAEAVRYDLISPIGLEAVARTCAEGAEKYGDWNWEKGMPVHDLLNHALRHIYLFLSGDREEPHLPHAAWNLLAAIHSDAIWPEINAGTLRGKGCKAPQP